MEELFVNENDGTNEGLIHKTKPIMTVQFHPEAMAGPLDTVFLFDVFLDHVKQTKMGMQWFFLPLFEILLFFKIINVTLLATTLFAYLSLY